MCAKSEPTGRLEAELGCALCGKFVARISIADCPLQSI